MMKKRSGEEEPKQTVLVIDDEKNIRRTLRMVLESEGYKVLDSERADTGLALLETEQVHCIMLDLWLAGQSGMDALKGLYSEGGDGVPPVIMISGHGTIADAVQATQLGAFDFLEKPLDRDRVIIALRNALRQQRVEREVAVLRREVSGRNEMIGSSPAMRHLAQQISKVAPTRGRVLISGESGTGKELIARAIHRGSSLRSAPFIKVNCAAIPPELIESELFGHERGAFTGAHARKRGLFESANGGTLVLDEIGDMSLAAQAKVLRVLQQGELIRVGGEKTIKVDVRVLAATNKDLAAEVQRGTFREDLYFRLNVVPIWSPPLRDRREDIPEMVDAFVAEFCVENGFRGKRVDSAVMDRLVAYEWPGNVRELKNVIERAVIMSDSVIRVEDLPPFLGVGSRPQLGLERYRHLSLKVFRETMEREFLEMHLNEHRWNISQTASVLGIERTNLHKKIRAYGLQRSGTETGA